MVRGYIESLAVVETCQDDRFLTGPVRVGVEVTSAQCPDGAMSWVAVCFLIDTYHFPPILMVVQFHGGAICKFDLFQGGISRQTAKVTLFVFSKESDVPKLEFLSLF